MKSEFRSRLALEIKLVPPWAWMLAVALFVSAQLFFNFAAWPSNGPPAWVREVVGGIAGIGAGCYLLFVGYISRDAKRRRMSALLWTLVAILIPHGLGVILYFLLRQPLRADCPKCASAVYAGFNFCPRCSYELKAERTGHHRQLAL